jgi:hypothetical protein
VHASYGIPASLLPRFTPLLTGFPAWATEYVIPDLQARLSKVVQAIRLPLHQVIALPLSFEERLLGVIYLFRSGGIAFSTFRTGTFRCRVCITFQGRTDCRTAAAETREEAQRTATVAACAQLAGGMTDSNQCQNTRPDSVEWLQ